MLIRRRKLEVIFLFLLSSLSHMFFSILLEELISDDVGSLVSNFGMIMKKFAV
jgi:hypothetical protein